MESINSALKFGNASFAQGDPPHHTDPEHRACAYYQAVGDADTMIMTCPHGKIGEGAFYNEDYIRALRTTAHELIAMVDDLQKQAHLVGPAMIQTVVFDGVTPATVRRMNDVNNLLRMLTK